MPARQSANDAATELMIEVLDAIGTPQRPLVVWEGSGRLAAALSHGRDCAPTAWDRVVALQRRCDPQPWPPPGPFDAALVRLPKDREALRFALHAAAASVCVGAPMLVFGANDEGARSAGSRLAEVAGDVATVRTARHARVIAGRRKAVIEGHKGRLADWRLVQPVELMGAVRPWVSYPGVFAKGRLDDGTRLLLAHLPPLQPGARVLDFAAGSGVIGAVLGERCPGAAVDLLDADTMALEAARENAPGARRMAGASLPAAGDARYDLIVSNPPIHDGIAESHVVLERLISEAPRHLLPGGRLALVVQRRVPVKRLLETAFGNAEIVADDGRFTVATATGRCQPS